MAAKDILVLCAQVLLIQSAFSQCVNRGAIGSPIGPLGVPNRGFGLDGLGYDGLAWNRGVGYPGPLEFTATAGGLLPVSSSSCMAPTGLSVVSENFFEGTLSVIGELPFIGAVALEGTLPTAGAGVINYGCGNGFTGMVSEGVGPAVGIPAAAGIPPGRLGYGYDFMY